METCSLVTFAEAPIEIIDGDRGKNYPKQTDFAGRGHCLFLNAGNVTSSGFNFSNCTFVTSERDALLNKGKLQRYDCVLTTRGTVGNIAFYGDDVGYDHIRINSGMVIIRPQKGQLDPYYLYLFLRSPLFAAQVKDLTSGSAQPQLPIRDIRRVRFVIPHLSEQQAIASILGALDDKIELNRRMNETLEAMARAIFKDWFVDFGPTRAKMAMRGEDPQNENVARAPYLAPDVWSLFPDRLDADGKPEGWGVKPLDQVADFLNGLALQKYPANGGASLPVIKIAQLRSANVASADLASNEIPKDYIVENGDVLFSWSGSLLHRVWTAGRGALNQHLFKVTSKQFPTWFFFHWIAEHMPSFQATAASKATTMGHIQRHHLTQALTHIGTPAVMKMADEIIGPLLSRQIANDLESRILAATRDMLLPKLMSGEVRVKDAERQVGEAT